MTGGSVLGRFGRFAENQTTSSIIMACAKLERSSAPTEALIIYKVHRCVYRPTRNQSSPSLAYLVTYWRHFNLMMHPVVMGMILAIATGAGTIPYPESVPLHSL